MDVFRQKKSKLADKSHGNRSSRDSSYQKGTKGDSKHTSSSVAATDLHFYNSRISENHHEMTQYDSLYHAKSKTNGAGSPIKKLMAQEMQKEVGSRRRKPNIIAKLMGLDVFPAETEIRSPECEKRNNNREPRPPRPSPRPPPPVHHPRHRREQEEFKDVYEVSEVPNTAHSEGRNQRKQNERHGSPISLLENENLRGTNEFEEALEVLGSRRDLLLKFLRETNRVEANHSKGESSRGGILYYSRRNSNETELEEEGKKPTRIVVLKPNAALPPPPPPPLHTLSDFREHGSEEYLWYYPDRKMARSRRQQQQQKGYSGDESSGAESDVRNSVSTVNSEGKKRLSKRWNNNNNSNDMPSKPQWITLGHILGDEEETTSTVSPDETVATSACNPDQPSPVSVLETGFPDDRSSASDNFERVSAELDGLRMQLQLLKMEAVAEAEAVYSEGGMVVSSDDEGTSSMAVGGGDKWEWCYVHDVVSRLDWFGFGDDDGGDEGGCADPLVFDEMELKYGGGDCSSRPDRKLLFDFIDSVFTGQRVVASDRTELTGRILAAMAAAAIDCGAFAENDGRWDRDRGAEEEAVGADIELLLFEELVADVILCI